jgi:FtsH-binding integral membrane protein
MSDSSRYPGGQPIEAAAGGVADAERARVASRVVFGQVMFLVAATLGFTAAGAWIGRDLSGGAAIACWVGAFVLILGLSFVRKARQGGLAMGLLFGLGLLLGLAIGPTLKSYTSVDGGAAILWQTAGLTALFVAGAGTYGWATRRDLTRIARVAFWSLLGLIGFGIIAIFVAIPQANIIYSVIGLVIFAVWTAFDFQRLRRGREEDAVMLAVSIYLDIFNVFLFILNLLSGSR